MISSLLACAIALAASPAPAEVGFGPGQSLRTDAFMSEARAGKTPEAPPAAAAGAAVERGAKAGAADGENCTIDRDFCEGMEAYLDEDVPGVIVKIYSDKEFYFVPDSEYHIGFTLPNERRYGLKVDSFQMTPARGCLAQYCVGDQAYVEWNGLISATVVGVSKQDGGVLVSEMHDYSGGFKNYMRKPEDVYLAKGCAGDHFCVGTAFIAPNGAHGTIVAVARNGEVVVRLLTDYGKTDMAHESLAVWPTSKIPR